jgi:tRNA-dihydrouridine synthase A
MGLAVTGASLAGQRVTPERRRGTCRQASTLFEAVVLIVIVVAVMIRAPTIHAFERVSIASVRESGRWCRSLSCSSSHVDGRNVEDRESPSSSIIESPHSFPDPRGATATRIEQHKFSVAPMMEYTDRHQRTLQRMITKEAVLYTEMVGCSTLTHTKRDPWIYMEAGFPLEEPLVLQLGGSDPLDMKAATKLAFDVGYRDINLNVGCPSEKVAGKGCFGAALMLDPHRVAELALAVSDVTNIPTTVKCRIGVNDNDSYEELTNFIRLVSERGHVRHFIVHARKAILNKRFTPDDNRRIPPLKYDYVYSLVRDFPHLHFTINGGISTVEEAEAQLQHGLAGVMIGRAVVANPWAFRNVDTKIYKKDQDPNLSRREILIKYAAYATEMEKTHDPRVRRALIKALLPLFTGEKFGKQFRIQLDINVRQEDMCMHDVIMYAMERSGLSSEALDSIAPLTGNGKGDEKDDELL